MTSASSTARFAARSTPAGSLPRAPPWARGPWLAASCGCGVGLWCGHDLRLFPTCGCHLHRLHDNRRRRAHLSNWLHDLHRHWLHDLHRRWLHDRADRHIHDHLPARHGALRAHDLHLARWRGDREGHARPDAGRHRHLHLLHRRRSRFPMHPAVNHTLGTDNNFAWAPTPSPAAAVAAAAVADDEEARDPRRARMALDHGPTRAARRR